MSSEDFNKLKRKLSEAYLISVVGKLNYEWQKSNEGFDAEGIDFQIKKPLVGQGGLVHIQLKGVSVSSTSMYEDKGDYILYTLKDKYERMCRPAYLVVVVFPSESDVESWCKIETDHLELQRCAYFMKLPSKSTGPQKISKEDVFNDLSLEKLFPNSDNKEEYF